MTIFSADVTRRHHSAQFFPYIERQLVRAPMLVRTSKESAQSASMNTSRRSFLSMGAAATAAALVFPGAAWSTATRDVSLPLSESEEALLAFITRYGGRARFVGIGVLEKIRFGASKHQHVLVEVADLTEFESALASLPFAGAYAAGNELAFEAGGTEFTLENLPAGAFDERRLVLSKARHIAFAHDALSYDPAARQLSDPFSAARAHTVKTVNRSFGSIEGLEVILRGSMEAESLGLRLGNDFQRWKNRLLRLAARDKDAAAIAASFLNQLATAADILPEETIKEILRSRSVKSALAQTLGVDVEAAITAFETARSAEDGSISNSAIWLSVLLKAQLDAESVTGVVTALLQKGSRFQVLRSRRALAQARQLLAA
jgi:hypothetical protein